MTDGTATDSTKSTLQSGLFRKLIELRRRVVRIEKDSTNKHGGYDYVSAEAMISKTRPIMLELGLVFYRESATIEDVCGCLVLKGRFACVDVESDQAYRFSMDLPCPPRKGMPEDKAAMSALTSQLNYALRDLLMVSRGREDQIEAIDDRAYDPSQARVAHAQNVLDADVVADTRATGVAEILGRMAKSPVTPDDAETMWVKSANDWIKKNFDGDGRTVRSLDEIPDQFAEMIVAKYRADYESWRRKEAA